ncbi:MAG: TIGR00296 family protein [Candidatus Micrarchaeia archaeon]
MKIYSLEEGEKLVKAARNSIELGLKMASFDKELVKRGLENFNQRYGVFVTIEYYPTNELRGCIGFPKAIDTVKNEIVEAALAAAFEDPRFPPLSQNELDDIVIEVSILSKPEMIKGNLLDSFEIGKDGLILEYGAASGLLLPVVPVEQGWNKNEFLDALCQKAGVPKKSCFDPNANLYKFETQIFREEKPYGSVFERVLNKSEK